MRTTSHISAVALAAAALLMTPQISTAQLLDGGGDSSVSVDADFDVGGDSGGSVDADVSLGSDSGSDDGSLSLDADLSGTDATVTSGTAESTEVDVEVLAGGTAEPSAPLITGDVRISALDETARAEALISLINEPNLADIDLDAAIDDTRVMIIAAADLLGDDALADVQAAIEIGGAGRAELLAAISSSSELTAILETEGVDLADVLAVQVGEDGATEVIILGGAVRVAALGENGNIADLTADELAALDIDLLSDEELAEIELALLPEEDQRLDAVLRILAMDTEEPGAVEEVEIIDLDVLLGEQSLAEVRAFLSNDGNVTELTLDAQLLALLEEESVSPDAVAAIRFGDNQSARVFIGGSLSEGNVASLQIGGTGSDEGGDDGAGADGDTDERGAGTADEGADTGDLDESDGAGTGDEDEATDTAAAPPAELAGIAPVSAEVAFPITEVGCTAGVSALASGADAPAAAVANADSLELVLVGGCSQPVEADNAERIQAAVEANPEISLEDMNMSIDDIIGATIDGNTVILYLYADAS